MKKDWYFIKKILSGQKTIESRWYKSKYSPWGKIKRGEIVYFKNSGEPIIAKAKISKIIEFKELTPKKVKEILNKYWKKLGITKDEYASFYRIFKDKKYCVLIFLENPEKVKPFNINKKGFGAMASWLCVEDLKKIKI
ncbi:MAG: ASCH domain-containing protein [Patescibacteria group bacterium]